MTKKRVLLEFVFDERPDEFDPESIVAYPVKVRLHSSELTDGQLDALGEEIAQTDRWQVDNWIAIQSVLGGETKKAKLR